MTSNPLTLRGAIIAASLVLLASLLVGIGVGTGIINSDISQRFIGVLLGALLIATGNYIPKTGIGEPHLTCEEVGLRRQAGWTFVLSGIACGVTWLVAPPKIAAVVCILIAAAAVLLVVASVSWGWEACMEQQRARTAAE